MVNHCGDIKAGARNSWSHLQSRVERKAVCTILAKPTFSSFFIQFRTQPGDGTACFKCDAFHINSHDHRHAPPPANLIQTIPHLESLPRWFKLGASWQLQLTLSMVLYEWLGQQHLGGGVGAFWWIAWLLGDKVNLRLLFFLHWNIKNIYVFRYEVMIHVKYMDECWRHWGNWKKRNKETYVYRWSKYMAVRGWGEWGMYSYP